MFFNDSTIHKIYLDKGSFNFIYQLPQIIFSSLIYSLLNVILKQLALSEKNILKLKENKKYKSINKSSKTLIKCLFYKSMLFFIIGFIYLLFFWYYISSFCAVYENTQIHLIKNTLKLYKFSKIIQLI